MKKIFSATIVLLCAATLFAQQETQPLPLDPNVRYGKLDNGLTYYIRHNEQPKQRAEFHIAQAVGAILEEDHQNGLAHFLEHMAFNGTEHFPGKGIINYFESIGVNFGGNINAYTSLDETVYRLSDVPTYREGIIDSALLVMHDWSCALSLLGDEIDAERGVIREEWRTGATASRRMWKQTNANIFPGSQYAKRDVIGDTAVINNFSYQALRDYYRKWYGPDLQAIVVVGDIDVDAIEAKIKALWADVPARSNRGERPVYEVADNAEPIVSIVTDKEAQNTILELTYKHTPLPDNLKGSMIHYLQATLNGLISSMLSDRFDELTQDPEASFVYGNGYYSELVKSKDQFAFVVVPKEGREKQALNDMLFQAEKMKRYGFTASELERAKTRMLADAEKSYNERDTRKNIALTREYIRHYLDGECIPGIEWEYNTLTGLLPHIQLDMLNQVAQSYVIDPNIIVSINAPEKESVVLPSKDEVLQALADIKTVEIEAPQDDAVDKPLVAKTPKAGKIKAKAANASLGTTEWTLANGIKVVIKPTEFKKDEILLTAKSRGGLSKVENIDDLPSAYLATDVVVSNGLGEFNAIELQKVLTGKIARVAPQINEFSETLDGNSSVKDFETMLQLVYLYFTAPRRDDKAYQALVNMYETALRNRDANPKTAFSDSIRLTVSDHNPRTMIFNLPMLEKVSQDKALALYKERFANPADFTFMFTGNIDPNDAATQKLICTWLGGLKTCKTREDYTDNGVRAPKGKVKNYFTRDMQIKTASNRLQFTAAMPYSWASALNMEVIGRILDIRYLESIREREGGSYGVGVYGYAATMPVEQAILLIQFDTDPEKETRLLEVIYEEINTILADGPRADDLHKAKESMLKDFAEDVEKNDWWDGTALPSYYTNKYAEDYLRDYRAAVEAVTPETVVNTLKQLIDSQNVVEVVMLPAAE